MGKKKVVQKEFVDDRKKPKEGANPTSYQTQNPCWRFKKCDKTHPRWSVYSNGVVAPDLIEKLISFEGMTWGEIQAASGGKSEGNGSNSHFEEVRKMSPEARKRLMYLNIYEDTLFSLRLTGRSRLYGIINDGIFEVLWLDRKHEVYPCK